MYRPLGLSRRITKASLIFPVIAALFVVALISAAYFAKERTLVFANSQACGDVYDPIPAHISARINQNKPVYIQAQNETGVPWTVMAAVHYREFNNVASNPHNGQGIYQLYSLYHHPNSSVRNNYRQLASPNTTVTNANFLEQTIIAAEFLQEKARSFSTPKVTARNLTKNESDIELIKNTLFSYNGRAGSYANQAALYGFDKNIYPYEGSPYVMSKFDCYRSAMGLIQADGSNTMTGEDTRMGAFTLYARLRGDAFWRNLQQTSMRNATQITSHVIDGTTDKSGERAKVGFQLSSKPSHNVTIEFGVNSPSNARMVGDGKVTITPSTWDNPRSNTVEIEGLNNPHASTIAYYSLVARSITSSDSRYGSLPASVIDRVQLANLPTGAVDVYRLYSSTIGKHYFTSDSREVSAMVNEGWRNEGVRFRACEAGASTVVRLTNENTGSTRLATYHSALFNEALSDGYTLDKPVTSASTHGNIPVYWRYDPVRERSLYTTSKTEGISSGFEDRGVAFSACSHDARAVFRMYRPSAGNHLFSISQDERNRALSNLGFRYENVGFYTCSSGDTDVYRLYNPSKRNHLMTLSATERDRAVQRDGFRYEGVMFKICRDDPREIYRLYRPRTGSHFFTSLATERDSAVSRDGFRYEGIMLKAL